MAGIFVALVVAVVVATPWILRAGVPDVFARVGLQASATGGAISLLRREITLRGFVLGAPDAPALSLGELGVGLDLGALVQGRVKLRHLRVKNVSIDVDRLLALKKLSETGSASAGALPVELDKLELEDVRLLSVGERIGHDVRISRLAINDLSALLGDGKSKVDLQGGIGDGGLELQLEVALDKQALHATGKFHMDKVPLRGWAKLASAQSDPLTAGVVNGRGDIDADYGIESKSLRLTLQGRVSVAGLGVELPPLQAEQGDADWMGKLALQWSPDMSTPAIRGEGSLGVEKAHLHLASSSDAPVQADVDDLSWHGDFAWQNSFTADGSIQGSRVGVEDASGRVPAWKTRSEDFSWRLHVGAEADSGDLSARLSDFELASLAVTVGAGDAPLKVEVEKLALDELRTVSLRDLVLGRATADTLTITDTAGTNGARTATYRIGALAAQGLSGEFSGKLHAASVGAESLDYAQSGRSLRAEEIDLASVGFKLPGWVGADELSVKSVRADEGQGDVWLSGLKLRKPHGDFSGAFAVETVTAAHMFQSASRRLSWDAADLSIRGVQGDTDHGARISAIDLASLKVGVDEASWESAGMSTADLALTMGGDVKAASFTLARLERRQPGVGDLLSTGLEIRGFGLHDARAVLDRVRVAALAYSTSAGETFEARSLEARRIAADRARGLEAGAISMADGSGHFSNGARLTGAALDARELSASADGALDVRRAELERLKYTDADAAVLDVDRLRVTGIRRAPDGHLSTADAALAAVRFTRSDGRLWTLEELDARQLDWDGDARISADTLALSAASQAHANVRQWRGQGLRAAGLHLTLPATVQVDSMGAASVDGGSASPAWKVTAVDASGFASSSENGQSIDRLVSGALTVSDERNGAILDSQQLDIRHARVSTLQELSARLLDVQGLRLRSAHTDWPARLAVAELRVSRPQLRFDGAVNLGAVVARNPYLIVAQKKDNTWMWPPVPGAGGEHATKAKSGEEDSGKAGSTGGIRLQSFVTSGSGRIVYIDRATEPAFQLVMDPFVAAVENLDTRLPGSVSHFRARGTHEEFGGLSLDGKLTKRVDGFDLGLTVTVKGAALPDFNGYIAKRESFAVTAGRGDIHSAFAIENHTLSGKADVLLSGLEVKSTLGGKVFELIDPANFPIRTALALLKDQQGNISLDIPLRARTTDPSFDFIDDFRTHFASTVTTAGKVAANLPGKTLNRAWQLLEGTISLLPGVEADHYAPVEFPHGKDELGAVPLVYLDQLGKRMRQHESLVLALCGRSVAGEEVRPVSKPSTLDTLFARARTGVYPIPTPGRKGLLELADTRAELVRRYLGDDHKIPAARLATCEALIDEAAGARPRVDLQVKTPAKSKGLFGIFP